MPVSVKFYLESKFKGDDKKLLPIFLYIRHKSISYNGRQIKVYTDRKCSRYAWDNVKERANERRLKSDDKYLNNFLNDLQKAAKNRFNANLEENKPTTKEEIQAIVNKLNNVGEEQKLPTLLFIEFAESFLANNNFSPNTKKSYQTTINVLKEYSKAPRKHLTFEAVNDFNFYDNFTYYLTNDKNLNDNSVGKNVKIIKSLMTEAFKRGHHSNLLFKQFKVFRRDADTIYLSEVELDRMLNLDLSENKSLSNVRDIFYVACWLGLRFSDVIRITKDKFIEEEGIKLFKIETQKTGEIVRIPIKPGIIPILKKHDYNLPKISNQKLNEYLKTLGKDAGINNEIEITDIKAGKKIRIKIPKYDLITSHTARRSFATNLYLQGVKPQSIMAITGHRTEKSFLSYLKLSNMQKIKEVDNHWKKESKSKMKVV